MKDIDIVIVGAGPAGLTAAMYLSRANMDYILLDKDAPGGRLLNIPHLENYPGGAFSTGPDAAKAFLKSAKSFGVKVTYCEVLSIYKQRRRYVIQGNNETYLAKAVIIASGISYSASVPGEKRFLHHGVSYCATCDGRFFKGKPVLVYEGEERGIEEAIYLSSLASEVYLVSESKIEIPASLAKAYKKAKNITLIEGYTLTSINGVKEVGSVTLSARKSERTVDVAGVFPLNGSRGGASFLSTLTLDNDKGYIITDVDMSTSEPGVFCAGDARKSPLRQAVTAAADGAIASAGAIKYVKNAK